MRELQADKLQITFLISCLTMQKLVTGSFSKVSKTTVARRIYFCASATIFQLIKDDLKGTYYAFSKSSY